MDTSYPIRPIAMSELRQFIRVTVQAFNSTWPEDKWLEWDKQLFEPERSLAAFDGDEIIGTTDIFSFGLTVPGGGQVGCAGVTSVGVLPSHRRRGVLSSLMTRQLADIAAGPEPVAALFASEAPIYGRYGYGVATAQHSYTIKRGEAQLPPPPAGLTLTIREPGDVLDQLRSLYDAVRPGRPGMLTRSDAYWNVMLDDPDFAREGSGPRRCLLAEDETGPRGYALYTAKPTWSSDGIPAHELSVGDLIAIDQGAATALWTDLLSRDLVGEIRARWRPVDDPLLHQLADPRRARVTYLDGLWIRVIDVPAALSQRRYACPVDLVIEVVDDRLAANTGRWHLQAGNLLDPASPTCERTTADPDLTLPVSALGAGYLGGTRLGALAQAGIISEHRIGAVTALSAAMFSDPAPWAPTHF